MLNETYHSMITINSKSKTKGYRNEKKMPKKRRS